MDEVFVEQIIKSKTSAKEIIYRVLVIFALIVSLGSFVYLGALAITIIALAGYLVYYVFKMTDIEYEYAVINADLTIEKIMGQMKRRKAAEYDLKQAVVMAYEDSDDVKQYQGNVKVCDYSSKSRSARKVVLVFVNGPETTKLVFEPNERVTEAIRHIRPSIVKFPLPDKKGYNGEKFID